MITHPDTVSYLKGLRLLFSVQYLKGLRRLISVQYLKGLRLLISMLMSAAAVIGEEHTA